ncbi:LOW QUALITY PROTEIN: coiled-coil domain-containing protein 17 [Mantella aurantiaca]
MEDLGCHRCHDCKMTFRSRLMLEKHREKFCVGSQIGDPSVLRSRYASATGHTPPPRQADTPDFRTRESIARLRAKENQLNERERLMGESRQPQDGVSHSNALKSLTQEFHKLRKSLEVSVPSLRSFQDSGWYSQWDREYRERMLEMAETHERQLSDIQSRNHTLEIQREEIRQRLSEMNNSGVSTNHIEQMLLELKAQEEKNQLALDALKDQVTLIQSESRMKEKTPKDQPGKKEKSPLTFLPFPVCGSGLSSEISALQLAYVQSGGSDAAVLTQMRDLQAEALAFEETTHRQERKEKRKKRHEVAPRTLDVELMAVEMENQRLEEEIFNLKLHRNRKKTDKGDSEMVEMQQEHIHQMAQLQADIEILKRDVGRIPPRGAQEPPPFQPPPLPPPQSLHPIRRPEPAVMMGAQDSTSPSPPGNRHILEPLDVLGPAPYDPVAGFVIFYDFLLGLDPTVQKVRLLSGLYSNGHKMGHSSSLPDALCEVWNSPAPRGNIAMLSAKQPIPRVRPSSSIALVMELQAAGGFNLYGQEVQHLSSSGWTKLHLFDLHNQVQSGRWKLPVRGMPLRPGLSNGQLNTVPQVGKAELYLRIVNARDADLQSMAEINPRNSSLYQYPPMMPSAAAPITDNPAPMTSFQQPPNSFQLSVSPFTDHVDPPPLQETPRQQRANQRDDIPEEDGFGDAGGREDRIGFIIDRVTDAPPGDGTLRLVGYHMDTGQVIRTRGKGLSCIVSAVGSSVQHGCFIFGEQEAVFGNVSPEEDMLLMLRFYHWPGGSTAWAPWQHRRSLQPLLASEEWIAAWAAVRLTRLESPETGADSADAARLVWNTGIHDLPLYHSPAPPVLSLSAIQTDQYKEIFEPYGDARVRVCVFGKTRPDVPFPPESPVNDAMTVPEGAYIPRSRRKAMVEPYASTEGITVFIDGARFLPDAATVTRVTGRIFDKNFDQIGPDISTGIDLNSDIFHPFFCYSVQINSPDPPPTSTLLLKKFLNRFSRDLSLIGWAAINLFVESATQRAPSSDAGGVQVSLNEGGHQIRLYHTSPPSDRPFSVESLASWGRIVPCATLLIRIRRGGSRQRDTEVPPEYSQGVYYSDTAQPSPGEVRLYTAMVSRSAVQVREAIPPLAGGFGPEMTPDLQLSDWLQKTFNEKMKDSAPRPFQLCCVSRYLVTAGMAVSVDSAQNLPWSGFTLAHISFNPPAAFYYGEPWMRYDRSAPVCHIDPESHQNCPVWRDGFQIFTGRTFHKFLTLVIHLHEIRPEVPATGGRAREFTAGSQAWTAMRVFYRRYCHLGAFQLPLYQGAPTLSALHTLRSGDCREMLRDLERQQLLSRVTAASVILRIGDGRRREELETFGAQDINQIYLPEDSIAAYTAQPNGRILSELAAPGEEEFRKRLVEWYRKYLRSYRQPKEGDNAAAGFEDKEPKRN